MMYSFMDIATVSLERISAELILTEYRLFWNIKSIKDRLKDGLK